MAKQPTMERTFVGDGINNRLLIAAVSALALHHFVFRKGEWHLQAPTLLATWLLSPFSLLLLEMRIGAKNVTDGIYKSLLTTACFTITIFASIVVFRLTRLRGFPGPLLAKVSKLWHVIKSRSGKNHLVLDDLHKQYGDFVRTGPNEITIFDADVLVRLDGPGSRTSKSSFYDILKPNEGITTIRDKPMHDQRRRIWVRALSPKVMPHYEESMVTHTRQLDHLIQDAASRGESVDFTTLAYWYAFDNMGAFTLSKPFNMLRDNQWHDAVSNLKSSLPLLGSLGQVPWMVRIALTFLGYFGIMKSWHAMTDWCWSQLKERIDAGDNSQNIASYIISNTLSGDSLENKRHLLGGEAIISVLAGSDTVAPTLAFIFYELAANTSQTEKLCHELQSVNIQDSEALEKLPHLNAIINETLRLHPAVLTGGNRDTPPEGMMIGGRYIPGGITIVAPRYTIFRSERCYEEPEKFIPERWYSHPELVKDSRSFLPFAQGRYSCVGKNLALIELRMVTAALVSKYHIRFVEGDNGISAIEGTIDQATTAAGHFDLVFTPRDAKPHGAPGV